LSQLLWFLFWRHFFWNTLYFTLNITLQQLHKTKSLIDCLYSV